MLSECLHYQGNAGYFLIEFLKWYFSKYWQVRTRRVFGQTITYVLIVYTYCILRGRIKAKRVLYLS